MKSLKKKKKRRGKIILIILLIIIVVSIIILIDSNTRLVTTEHILYYDNLPMGFDGFRIVLLADLHGNELGANNERLVESVKAANPDIITIAGDLIDRYQPGNPVKDQLKVAQALAEQLVDIAPVYYVTGNHEWDSGMVRELLEALEGAGVVVLRNDYAQLNVNQVLDMRNRLILAGVDDPGGPADMIKPNEFIKQVNEYIKPEFFIVMVHRNYSLKMLSELDVDLVLSGHAHGGMIRLPFTDGLVGPSHELFPTYTSGVYSECNTNMVVTRGLGNHLGWTRFLNNPEVVVVELRAK